MSSTSSIYAHWMTQEELIYDFHVGLDIASATRIGTYLDMPLYLTAERLGRGVFIVESQGVVTPQRGSHLLSWFFLQQPRPPVSLVVLDPQQDFKRLFAGMLGKTHTLFEVSFHDHRNSLKYNPLMHVPLIDIATPELRERTTRRQVESASALARILAAPFSAPNPRYPALPELLSQTLLACILHLRITEPFAPFSRLHELTRCEEKLFDTLTHSSSQQVRDIFEASLASLDGETRTRAFIPALSATIGTIFSDPNRAQATAQNDIDFTSLTREPIALFFTPPRLYDTDSRTINTLFFTQLLLTTLYAYEDRERGMVVPAYAMRLVLENFLAHCDFSFIEPCIEALRRYGISLVATGPSSVWGKHDDDEAARRLARMCGTHFVLNAASPKDCEHYARLCGSTGEMVAIPGQHSIEMMPEPLIWHHNIHTLYPGYALLVRDDGSPAIIEMRDAFDAENAAHTHMLRQPYAVNQSPCFDDYTPPAVMGTKREQHTHRAMMRHGDALHTVPAHGTPEKTFYQEIEESMRSIIHIVDNESNL